MAIKPEEILLRWFNFHLEAAGSTRRVSNFSSDVCDSECYTVLLGADIEGNVHAGAHVGDGHGATCE